MKKFTWPRFDDLMVSVWELMHRANTSKEDERILQAVLHMMCVVKRDVETKWDNYTDDVTPYEYTDITGRTDV